MNHAHVIRPLTALRFIAALLVFFSHYIGLPYAPTPEVWQSIFVEGHAGVTIFFALSGFLITLNYFPAVASGTFSAYTYFLKRFARIVPLYWVMLALTFLLLPYMPYSGYTPLPLINWTMMQSFFGGTVYSGILPAWSLSVEVSFYLIAPLILASCANSHRRNSTILLTWAVDLLLIGLGLVVLSRATGLSQPYGWMDSFFLMTVHTIFGRGVDFCIGIFLALVYLERRDTLWKIPRGASKAGALFVLSAIGIVGLQIVMNRSGGVVAAWYLNSLIALMGGFMILSLTCPDALPSRLLSAPLPVYMGQISYALYLVHTTPLAQLIYPFFKDSLVIFYGVMNLISAGFYQLVERPGRQIVLSAGAWLQNQAVRVRGRYNTTA